MTKKEYIGADIQVVKTNNSSLMGLEGVVILETKNTFIIKTKEKRKTVLKNGTTFKIDGKEVNGNQISKRPEERIKC